jgi:Bifunctional DNA primase/polymerase, N-terminal.
MKIYNGERKELSTVFDQQNAGFVLLPSGKKFPPNRKGWGKNPYSFQEIQKRRGNRNIGIIAQSGNIILDVDDPSALDGLELPASTKWETRPGRYAMLFTCDDCVSALAKRKRHAGKDRLNLYDSRNLDGDSYYHPIGEIKLGASYQVIPPSWKEVDGNRTEYRFLNGGEIDPQPILLGGLLDSFEDRGISLFSGPSSKGTRGGRGTGGTKHRKERDTHQGTIGG